MNPRPQRPERYTGVVSLFLNVCRFLWFSCSDAAFWGVRVAVVFRRLSASRVQRVSKMGQDARSRIVTHGDSAQQEHFLYERRAGGPLVPGHFYLIAPGGAGSLSQLRRFTLSAAGMERSGMER